jgi:uncharacterized RDD family membrane protein YckC
VIASGKSAPSAPVSVDTLHRVETPENISLTFRLAGVWTRMHAYCVDLLLIGLASVVFITGLAFFDYDAWWNGMGQGLIYVLLFVIQWGYFWLFEALFDGRTFGKSVVGLRVVKIEGHPISFYDAMLRNLLRAVDVLPFAYGAGFLSIVSTRRLQRLGDIAAGTVVVRERRARFRGDPKALLDLDPIPPVEIGSSYRPPERVLTLIETLFRRRRQLHPARADEIAALIAVPLSERIDYRGEPNEPIDDPAHFLFRVLRTFGSEDSREGGAS